MIFLLYSSRRKESAVNNLPKANELVKNIALGHRIGTAGMYKLLRVVCIVLKNVILFKCGVGNSFQKLIC